MGRITATLTLVITFTSSAAAAEPACGTRIDTRNLVACALAASASVAGQTHAVEAAHARELAVSPLLPSNPALAISIARRSRDSAHDFNWSAQLSQEIEIGGQRGARRAAAHADIEAEDQRLVLSRRSVAAQAWLAFYELLGARDLQLLAASASATADALASAARARADGGLSAPIEADVADAAALRVLSSKLAATRQLRAASSHLASLLGKQDLGMPLEVNGELTPLPSVDQAAARSSDDDLKDRPELRALQAEQTQLLQRAEAHRRARIPNPTLALFAQDEGFTEHILGLGLSVPIPLPGEVGRMYTGEIAEAEATARQVESEYTRIQRELRLTLQNARNDYTSRREEALAFTPVRVERARSGLLALSSEVANARLSVRDAIVTQTALLELLQADVTARAALCVASVELALALGMQLEGWEQ
jgi:outer membrane protein, heavy metal efflux system